MRSLIVVAVLVLTSFARGQTTQPATKPSNGLALTDEQIRARLDAMNRKAANGATSQPADASSTANRLGYIESQKRAADAALREYQADVATVNAATEAIPRLQQEIAVIRQNGSAAERQLNAILQQYDQLRAMANKQATFEGGGFTASGEAVSVSGTIDDPAARLAAIMAVENQYGPELKRARMEVSELYAQFKSDATTLARATRDLDVATRRGRTARNRYIEAMKAAGFAEAKLPAGAADSPADANAPAPATQP
jgi:chromosome segregation ATPase